MDRLHDVVRATVDPEIDVSGGPKWVVGVEAGQGDDSHAATSRGTRGVNDVRRAAAATDENRHITGVAPSFDRFRDRVLVSVVIGETGHVARRTEGESGDGGCFGQVQAGVSGVRPPPAVSSDERLRSARLRVPQRRTHAIKRFGGRVVEAGPRFIEESGEERHVWFGGTKRCRATYEAK